MTEQQLNEIKMRVDAAIMAGQRTLWQNQMTGDDNVYTRAGDGVNALLAEVRRLQEIEKRFVEAYEGEDNAALDALFYELKGGGK